jgi:hypothetical protein
MIDLTLYNPVKRGNTYIGNITDRAAAKWMHSRRRIGGCWTATCDYRGSRAELDDFFLDGLMHEIRASANGATRWEGFIGAMSYMRDGILWVRTLADRYNAIKSIYARLGDNLLTNGSVESGAWTAYNSATVTQSSEWFSDGSYSCKIVVADSTVRGATIQAAIPIAANTAHEARVYLHILSGSWRVQLNRSDTGKGLGHFSTKSATGDMTALLRITADNTYEGNIDFLITSEGRAGTIYADGAVLQSSPVSASTDWKIDPRSVAVFGQMQSVLLRGALTNETANAEVATLLANSAWPLTVPPDDYAIGQTNAPDKLSLSLFGYVFTLKWRYALNSLTDTMSAIVRALAVQQDDYMVPGLIETNATPYQIDTRAPLTLWQILSALATAGDVDGNRWSLGVEPGRQLIYQQTPTRVDYKLSKGVIEYVAGGPAEPALIEPGWLTLADAPNGPGWNGSQSPRSIYLEEVEYSDPGQVHFRRKASDNG